MFAERLLIAACALLLASSGCAPEPTPTSRAEISSLAELLGAGNQSGFALAKGTRNFEFPRDHAAHPAYRNEWWYLTGNLESDYGRHIGYEFTLFRFAIAKEYEQQSDSHWQTRDVFIGHFAVTDTAGKNFHVAERISRGAAGLAGATAAPLRIWLYDWTLRGQTTAGEATTWLLQVADGGIRLELALTPLKPVVLNGDAGLSQKSADSANASWYYSVPRLETAGSLTMGDERLTVTGLSWLDREFSSSALARNQQGWDWFALQLDDGSDLMFYQLRRTDGSKDPFSAGTWVSADGEPTALASDDVDIEVLGHWDSPRGGRYPQGWRLRVPSRNVDVRIHPVMADQELATQVRYWEGAVTVSGTHAARRLEGRGYVELTGYAVDSGAATID